MEDRILKPKKNWIPLSPEQEIFWLYYRFTGDSLNIIFKIELGSSINPDKVSDSFNAVIAEHDIFWYQTARYTARQHLAPVFRIDIERGQFLLKNREELDKVMATLKAPFSLDDGPKIRARLMLNPNSSYTLYLAAPHLVIDYIAMILINKSFMAYMNNVPLPVDHIATYAEYIAGEYTEEGLRQRRENLVYWRETLKNAKPFRMQREYIPTGPENLRTIHLRLSHARYTAVITTARQLGIPDVPFFYTCFYTALHLLTGSPDFVFSFMFAIKRKGALANTLGPMIGLLPISYSFSPDESLAETIRQIYQLVKTAHKDKKFLPNIDLMSSTPDLLEQTPPKYRLLTGLYSAIYRLFGKHMVSPKNLSGAIRKTKSLGQATFSKQASEPYEVMFNPRLSKDMRGEPYSLWIADGTQTLAISGDDEATDYRPEGIYFTLNYDTQDYIELHSTPFINPKGQEKFIALLETIFDQIVNNGDILLKELMSQP